jgi:uncharacterized protein YkwD
MLVAAAVLWAPAASDDAPGLVAEPEAQTQAQPQAQAQVRELLLQAEPMVADGRFGEAEPLLRQAIAADPGKLRPHGLLGVVLQAADDEDGAKDEYALMQRGVLVGPRAAADRLAGLGAEVIWLVNETRRTAGLHMLRPHPVLSLIALSHSEGMRDKGYFAHESPDPNLTTPAQRFAAVFGFRPGFIAENIAMRRSSNLALSVANVRESHRQLMSSPGHRANILNDVVLDFGVGIAASRKGDFWVTEEFVRFVL